MSEKQPGSDFPEPDASKPSSNNESAVPTLTPRHWLLRHKLVVAIGILVSLGFGHYWLTLPSDNPLPQKKIVVRGSFPYDRGWDLRMAASYYSKNPTCRQTARAFFFFPQAEVSREGWRTIPVIREGGDRYRFEFHEDSISPGFCDWTFRFVNFSIIHNGKEIDGSAILGFPRPFNTFRFSCSMSTIRRDVGGVTCYEGDNRWNDPSHQYVLIDFLWEEKTK